MFLNWGREAHLGLTVPRWFAKLDSMSFPKGFPAALVMALAFTAPLHAQAPQADATLPLFTVMAALNVAASGPGSPGPYNSPLGRQLQRDLAGKALPSVEELRRFYASHRLPDPVKDYSRYVSFALVIGGPPDFGFRVREAELPPDARVLDGLNPLVAAFYTEANIEQLWEKYRPAYDQEAAVYQEGIARVMLEVNGYLRNPTVGYLGRNFSVYLDLLGPPNQANARSFGPDYYVVVTSSAPPQLDHVRHGYLHYVLEPLAAKYSALVRAREKLREVAARAPALDPVLRSNFRMLLTEALIRAAELRMTREAPEGKQKRMAEDVAEGHFLAPYFFEALEKFEQQDAGIRLYYPTLIEKLEVRREERRAEKVIFRAATGPGALSETVPQPAASDDIERFLAEGEDALARQDLPAARQAFRSVLERTSEQGLEDRAPRARALYSLALVATQEKQPEVAKNFFQQTLEAGREPRLLAWAHIYLGRLFDMENNRDLAIRHYKQALEAGDPAPRTRQAAERGLEAPFRAR